MTFCKLVVAISCYIFFLDYLEQYFLESMLSKISDGTGCGFCLHEVVNYLPYLKQRYIETI